MFPACEKSESFNFPMLLEVGQSILGLVGFPCIPDHQIFRVDSIQGFSTLKWWKNGVWYSQLEINWSYPSLDGQFGHQKRKWQAIYLLRGVWKPGTSSKKGCKISEYTLPAPRADGAPGQDSMREASKRRWYKLPRNPRRRRAVTPRIKQYKRHQWYHQSYRSYIP